MFVQSAFAPTLNDLSSTNDVRTLSHLALNAKLNDALSSINEDSEEGITSTQKTSSATSFSQVMASVNASSKQMEASPSQQKTLLPFSSALNGDYLSSFKMENPTPLDKVAEPQGMARGVFKEYSPQGKIRECTIDKTSVLYEKALELESYFVKIMMQSMRATLSGQTLIGEESFASKMYKDMMYDELNRTITKNAGLGLADHIYLQLHREGSN